MSFKDDIRHERELEQEAAGVLAAQELTNIAVALERIGGRLADTQREIAGTLERIAIAEETRAKAAADIAEVLVTKAARRAKGARGPARAD